MTVRAVSCRRLACCVDVLVLGLRGLLEGVCGFLDLLEGGLVQPGDVGGLCIGIIGKERLASWLCWKEAWGPWLARSTLGEVGG